jgi:hypothetical protein
MPGKQLDLGLIPQGRQLELGLKTKGPGGPKGPRKPPPGDDRHYNPVPESSKDGANKARDNTIPGRVIHEPNDAFAGNPHGEQVMDDFTGTRLKADELMAEIATRMEAVKRSYKHNYNKVTKAFFEATEIEHSDPKAYKRIIDSLTPDERAAFKARKAAYDHGWDLLEEAGLVGGVGQPQRIHDYNHHIWRELDFEGGKVPPELEGQRLTGNVMFRGILAREGAEGFIRDAAITDRAYFAGLVRKLVWEPFYQRTLERSKLMPPQMRGKAEAWVGRMKGKPSFMGSLLRNVKAQKMAQNTPMSRAQLYGINSAEQIGALITHAMYRGALLGKQSFAILNLVTQGFINPAAAHGITRTMEGIGRHFSKSWRGLEPSETLLGGFRAIWDDIPMGGDRGIVSDITSSLLNNPKTGRFFHLMRDTASDLDNWLGPQMTEKINRGIGFQVGLGQAIERIEQRLGRARGSIRPEHLTDGSIPAEMVHEAYIHAVRTSDEMNFLYGTWGTSPELRGFFGGRMMGATTMFMSYYGKEMAFLYRQALKKNNPGIILRYFAMVGLLERIGNQFNIDTSRANVFEELPQIMERTRFGVPPVGPPMQLPFRFIQAVDATARGEEDRGFELFKQMGEIGMLMIPASNAVREKMHRDSTSSTGIPMRISYPSCLRTSYPWLLVYVH